MDFYLDFMRTLEKSPDPEATLRELTEMVKGVIEQAPARVALAEGAALLAVIHDYQNPQAIQTLPAFHSLKESVELLLAALDADLDLEEHLWGEESECRSSPQRIDNPESELWEGLSKYFLDFEHIESWGKARWAAFVAQANMVVDAAATSSTGLDSMSHLLSKIRNNFDRIPVESQKQALIVVGKLVLAIRENMERAMDTMHEKYQIELITDMGDWDGENDPADGFIMETPGTDEFATSYTSEILPHLDLSGWANWSEEDWAIFDQAVSDALEAAIAEPADPAPAMYLFIGIRQNIETLALHRRFSMGNTADNLMEAIKKGMAQDLFQVQQKCPYLPMPRPIDRDADRPLPQCDAAPASDGNDRRWKRGKIGRETVELDFDHLDEWNLSQWAALKIHADKLTAAAELTTGALGQPGQLLEDIRAHLQQVPQHYKDDVSQMVTQLVQAINGRASETLTEISRYCEQGDTADRS